MRHVSKFMWGQHHNYPLKFMPCVHFSFLIFVSNELINAKYEKSNINELKKKKKTNHVYSIKIITQQRSLHFLSNYKLGKKMIISSIKFR